MLPRGGGLRRREKCRRLQKMRYAKICSRPSVIVSALRPIISPAKRKRDKCGGWLAWLQAFHRCLIVAGLCSLSLLAVIDMKRLCSENNAIFLIISTARRGGMRQNGVSGAARGGGIAHGATCGVALACRLAACGAVLLSGLRKASEETLFETGEMTKMKAAATIAKKA